MSKKVEKWLCEHCGGEFSSEESASRCEERHAVPTDADAIRGTWTDSNRAPSELEIYWVKDTADSDYPVLMARYYLKHTEWIEKLPEED